MNSEEILRAFLTDDLIIDKGHLKKEEAENYKWFSHSNNKLIEVIKMAIEGETSSESPNVTEKKINKFLNQQ
jgi:hypothetical protein